MCIVKKSSKHCQKSAKNQFHVLKEYENNSLYHTQTNMDNPELPPEARVQHPALFIIQKETKTEPRLREPSYATSLYSDIQWETTPTKDETDRSHCILCITSKVPLARLDTNERKRVLRRLTTLCQEHANVLGLIGRGLHGNQSFIRGFKTCF